MTLAPGGVSDLNPKVYVDVCVDHTKDGVMLPRVITWEDGTKYEIRQAAAMKAGAMVTDTPS